MISPMTSSLSSSTLSCSRLVIRQAQTQPTTSAGTPQGAGRVVASRLLMNCRWCVTFLDTWFTCTRPISFLHNHGVFIHIYFVFPKNIRLTVVSLISLPNSSLSSGFWTSRLLDTMCYLRTVPHCALKIRTWDANKEKIQQYIYNNTYIYIYAAKIVFSDM